MNQKNLEVVDWTAIPEPTDDGAANHLKDAFMPDVVLPSTSGERVNLGYLSGCSVLYFYPMTGRPDIPLPTGWDDIPGARGCTPQSCAFRDLSQDLTDKGVTAIYGISTQNTEYQQEAASRLHLPFALLSDAELKLTAELRLPTMEMNGKLLLKRLTLVLQGTQIKQVFFPVFPPDTNAMDVMKFLESCQW